jgi:hypothetical protein
MTDLISEFQKEMSLVDYRDMLGEIAQPLGKASRGDLLAPPAFLKFFDKLRICKCPLFAVYLTPPGDPQRAYASLHPAGSWTAEHR